MTHIAAYVVLGIVGVIVYNLARSGPKSVVHCYMWMITTGWLSGAAMALFAWRGAR